jgi:threonine dehydrogenase-like Zn-dependent dehydrogenase
VIPDDTAGRPLTPGEQAAIADLERRLLLDNPVPVRDLAVAPPVRVGSSARRRLRTPVTSVVPLVALLGAGCLLIALLVVIGAGLLGAAAVLVSVVATALVWPLLPTRWGGPVRPARPPRRPYRSRGQLPGRP